MHILDRAHRSTDVTKQKHNIDSLERVAKKQDI